MAGLVYQFAKILYSQQASSEVQMSRLVGRSAEVTVAIPVDGVGQISLSMAGERSEHVARSKGWTRGGARHAGGHHGAWRRFGGRGSEVEFKISD